MNDRRKAAKLQARISPPKRQRSVRTASGSGNVPCGMEWLIVVVRCRRLPAVVWSSSVYGPNPTNNDWNVNNNGNANNNNNRNNVNGVVAALELADAP